MRTAVFLTFGLLVLFAPRGLLASDGEHGGTVEHRHRAEVFLGVAHEVEEDSNEFASGVIYEYRVSSLLGVGSFVEHAGEAEDTWTLGIPLFVHPYKGVRFLLAPGWEVKEVKAEEEGGPGVEGEEAGHERPGTGKENTEHERSFLVRAGVAYEMEVGRWSITPEFNVDLIEGGQQVLVYGVSLGCGF